jgi:hypothetical protein
MKHRRSLPVKTFAVAFILTLCVLGFGLACLVIEWNMQTVLYGEVQPTGGYRMEQGVPVLTRPDGQPVTVLTEKPRQALWALLPPPARATLTLLQGESAACGRLWEWIFARKSDIE